MRRRLRLRRRGGEERDVLLGEGRERVCACVVGDERVGWGLGLAYGRLEVRGGCSSDREGRAGKRARDSRRRSRGAGRSTRNLDCVACCQLQLSRLSWQRPCQARWTETLQPARHSLEGRAAPPNPEPVVRAAAGTEEEEEEKPERAAAAAAATAALVVVVAGVGRHGEMGVRKLGALACVVMVRHAGLNVRPLDLSSCHMCRLDAAAYALKLYKPPLPSTVLCHAAMLRWVSPLSLRRPLLGRTERVVMLAEPVHPAVVRDAHDAVASRRANLGIGRAAKCIVVPAVGHNCGGPALDDVNRDLEGARERLDLPSACHAARPELQSGADRLSSIRLLCSSAAKGPRNDSLLVRRPTQQSPQPGGSTRQTARRS